MSIAINGVDKPSNCEECIVETARCPFYKFQTEDCPISQLPKGARMVDANSIVYFIDDARIRGFDYATRFQIESLPTVFTDV